MKIPLFGGTGSERYTDVSGQLTQNWYVHKPRSGKSQLVVYPTPGETLFTNIGDGPIRGGIKYNDLYYVVSGNLLYEVNNGGASVLRGTLNTSVGRVGMEHNGADNGQQLLIVDGTNGYIYDSGNGSFFRADQITSGLATNGTANKLDVTGETFITKGAQIGQRVFNTTAGTSALITALDSETVLSIDADIFSTATDDYAVGDEDFPSAATHVGFFDGFLIVNKPSITGQFAKSASYDATDWDVLEIATAERSPDKLVGLLISNRQLWLVGEDTAEKWYNSGAADFPFEPDQSGFSEWGTSAPYSMVDVAGTTFWLSNNQEGSGLIVATTGGTPQVISSPEISTEISNMSVISDCYSYAYQYQQHAMVVFTFPTAQKTLVYDILTQEWHTWVSKNLGYHRSTTHTFIFGKHLVGDPENGNVYYLDWDNKTDNGDQIIRRRISAKVHAEDRRVKHEGVWIDIKEGVGTTAVPDPSIYLRYRDNNGPWSSFKRRSMGKVGQRGKKVVWWRLGASYDREYEIMVSDPVDAVLIDAFARLDVSDREIG